MKNFKIILLILVVSLAGCTNEAPDQTRYENSYTRSLPEGSRVLQFIKTKAGRTRYVIFVFRERCYMMYGTGRRGAMTEVSCM